MGAASMIARLLAALCLLLSGLAPALAQWPDKPVKLLVPYPAGGAADLPARIVADGLQKKFGKPFIVENRAGAAGQIGTEQLVRSAPDGYTIYCGPNGPYVLLPLLRQTSYKVSDLVPIAPYGELVYGFGVLKSAPYSNLKELQAHAKANPGKLSYSSPGAGSVTHLRGEAFNIVADVKITHIPYRTGAEALPDMLAGRVDVMNDNLFFPHARRGEVKILGVMSRARHPEFPDVATFAEQGFPVDLPIWGGLLAPVGIPQPIVDALAKAMAELAADAKYQEKMLKIGFITYTATQADMLKQLAAEVEHFRSFVQKTNFKLE
jgi:tripartite-type tricarboxylate transporter receptor subunit TctC